jgi:CubicO group peptidase (beta-lactamase class C family)
MLRTVLGLSVTAGVVGWAGSASGQSTRYDWSEVIGLAAGAVNGQNVSTPVPGFELLLMKDGVVEIQRAFGTWTVGRVANADSSTKTLSGALIVSLFDSSPRPFSLDTRLSQYIPAYTGAKATITIRQSFSHTSGLPGNSTAVSNGSITLQQAALDIAAGPLQFSPGTVFSYGGTSMHSAGAVAEIVGEAPWNTLFAQRIAGPLGLSVTRFVLTSPNNPRIAGGCESNAAEFGRFMEMLRRGGVHGQTRILSENAVQTLFTRQSPVGIPVANSPLGSGDYGVGVWLDQRDRDGRLIGALAGGARGFCSWVDFDDGMTGVFSTDLTLFGNIENLQYLIRAAAERAVRAPLPCPGDVNRDGAIDFNDLLDYLNRYNAGSSQADLNADGVVDLNDLLEYLNRYNTAC